VVVGVGDELVLGAAVFDDELHAVAPTSPSTNASTKSVRVLSVPVIITAVPSFECEQRTLPPMTENRDVESAERIIPAPPEAIFALLVDPSRHHEIDGSGSVHEEKKGSHDLKLGDEFSMAMKQGVPYSTTSTVIDFEANRRIAWHTCSPNLMGKIFGGPIWRYELEPVEGGTRVTESWDVSPTKLSKPLLRIGASRKKSRESMEKTLENIETLLATS
jgi:uncharacterized protein YndB with AHSA1/START domain